MRNVYSVLLAVVILFTAEFAGAEDNIRHIRTSVEKVKVYSEPGGSVLGDVRGGVPVRVLDEKGDWYKISTIGWIDKYFVKGQVAGIKKAPQKRKKAAIDVTSFEITKKSKYETGDVPRVLLRLKLKNNTKKKIVNWRALMFIEHPKVGIFVRMPISSGKKPIEPLGDGEALYYWKSDETTYDDLLRYPKSSIKIRLVKIKINER